MKKIVVCFLLSSLCFSASNAKSRTLDSLVTLVKTEKNDTIKVANLIHICNGYDYTGNLDMAIEYGKKACDLAHELIYPDGIAYSYIVLGNAYSDKGAYPQAMDVFMKSLKVSETSGNKSYIQMATASVGLIYYHEGDYMLALDYYLKALKMSEEAKDYNSTAINTSNIGTVYVEQKDYKNAEKYFRISLEIDSTHKNESGVAADLNNIGAIYQAEEQYETALKYFNRGLILSLKVHDVQGSILNKIDIGQIKFYQKQYKEAEDILSKSLASADSMQLTEYISQGAFSLSQLYEQTGQWEKAYKTHLKYTTAQDSMVSESKSKDIGKLEAKSDYDKELMLQHAELDKKQALADAESKKQKLILQFTTAVALAIAIIAIIIFRSLKITRKQKVLIETQKTEVETQKALVEEKNKEVLDSITYAKRLQDAILPGINEIQKSLPESFVLYKPKAIVAGDFYWMEVVASLPSKGGISEAASTEPSFGVYSGGPIVLIAAADCTGHGVPGAMVSVVCSNALNRAVKEFNITNPGKILDKVRDLVLETFEKSGSDVKDGMDISLCSINKSTGEVLWSGAYNPLWYSHNKEQIEVVPNKQPIGKQDNPVPFTTHTIKLQKGDILYLFTDGYADQFGGPNGKKYKYKQLSDLLKGISDKPMDEQKKVLEKEFDGWKGDMEQTDDVCIIGIRL